MGDPPGPAVPPYAARRRFAKELSRPQRTIKGKESTHSSIGDPAFAATSRVRSLTPELSKGLEFDLVILIDPEAFGSGIEGAVDRYVAMTRATRQLVILTSS